MHKDKEKLAGNEMLIFRCQSVINNQQKLFELKYELKTCKWILWKLYKRGMKVMSNKLSEKQKIVLELMHLFGLKLTSTMHSYLGRLKEKEYITWKEGMPRTIQVLKRA